MQEFFHLLCNSTCATVCLRNYTKLTPSFLELLSEFIPLAVKKSARRNLALFDIADRLPVDSYRAGRVEAAPMVKCNATQTGPSRGPGVMKFILSSPLPWALSPKEHPTRTAGFHRYWRVSEMHGLEMLGLIARAGSCEYLKGDAGDAKLRLYSRRYVAIITYHLSLDTGSSLSVWS